MKFTLEIELGSEAMVTLRDVNNAIFKALNSRSGLDDLCEEGDGNKVWDANGNTVGRWEVTDASKHTIVTISGGVGDVAESSDESLIHILDMDNLNADLAECEDGKDQEIRLSQECKNYLRRTNTVFYNRLVPFLSED